MDIEIIKNRKGAQTYKSRCKTL